MTAAAARTTEEFSASISPHPIMRRDPISRSATPSLRYYRPYIMYNRSEGVAERDIGSLGVMGWGLMLAENSSVAAAAVVAAVTDPLAGEKSIFG